MNLNRNSITLEVCFLWWPIAAASIAGVLVFSQWADTQFVINTPNQYGQWILTVFVTGLIGTMAGLISLVWEIRNLGASNLRIAIAFLLLCLSFICGGILLVHTRDTTNPGVPDHMEDALLILFAVASLIAVALKASCAHGPFWTARLLAVELPATLTIVLVVLAKYIIYDSSTVSFSGWLWAQKLYLGKELAEKAQINATATIALRDSFWIGVGFGVVGVQLLISTLAATAIDFWRISSAKNHTSSSEDPIPN